jgi:transcriptional regulator with XRE-family HTH domain
MKLTEQIAEAGWTVSEFARRIGRPRSTVMRWIEGTAQPPQDVVDWLDATAAYHLAHPYQLPPR